VHGLPYQSVKTASKNSNPFRGYRAAAAFAAPRGLRYKNRVAVRGLKGDSLNGSQAQGFRWTVKTRRHDVLAYNFRHTNIYAVRIKGTS